MKNVSPGINFQKIIFIIILGILLIVPLMMISSTTKERSERKKSVTEEITSKWGRSQEISGPVLVIPFNREVKSTITENNVQKTLISYQTEYLQVLPSKLRIESSVKPESRKRGIYESVVYTSTSIIKGDFEKLQLEKEGILPENVEWAKAKLIVGISDLKGLGTFPEVSWNNTKIEIEGSSSTSSLFRENLTAPLDLSPNKTSEGSFSITLDVRGSDFLSVAPLGKQTQISINGKWGIPSFDGDYLPDDRTVTSDSFKASWNIHSVDRKLPQQWTSSNPVSRPTYELDPAPTPRKIQKNNIIKVAFLSGVDLYQQTERTLKYGILIIALAFLALIFTEILTKTTFHIIQYALIGFALVVFYTLLLSLSEHIGFSPAYLLAFLTTNGIVTWFVRAVSKNNTTALMFAGILTLFFGFNYVLMQLEDYSLLVGSVGIFIILLVLMYITTKVNWQPTETN